MSPHEDLFGPVIFAYTRAQALEDGEQIAIPADLSTEAGIRFPVFITRGAYYATVAAGGRWETSVHEPGETLVLPAGQDHQGRLWDVLTMLRHAARRGGSSISFSVLVDEKGTGHPRAVKLISECGPMDMDKPEPVITIMLPEEQ